MDFKLSSAGCHPIPKYPAVWRWRHFTAEGASRQFIPPAPEDTKEFHIDSDFFFTVPSVSGVTSSALSVEYSSCHLFTSLSLCSKTLSSSLIFCRDSSSPHFLARYGHVSQNRVGKGTISAENGLQTRTWGYPAPHRLATAYTRDMSNFLSAFCADTTRLSRSDRLSQCIFSLRDKLFFPRRAASCASLRRSAGVLALIIQIRDLFIAEF